MLLLEPNVMMTDQGTNRVFYETMSEMGVLLCSMPGLLIA